MKTLSYLLLSLVLIQMIFASFLPIPFLGVVVAFTLTPLAHLVSWRDLLFVNSCRQTIETIRNLEGQIFMLNMIPGVSGILQKYPILYGYYSISVIFTSILVIFVITICQKAFYHILPKRLRIERVGY